MELAELQSQWQRLDQKLERTLNLESEMFRMAVTHPARRRINRSVIWPAIDIVVCVAIFLFVGSFLYRHWNVWFLATPAGVVMLAAILLLGDSIRQLIRVSEINWDSPVVDIQSALSQMRIAMIRQFKWIILLCPLVGFCGLIVGLQWLMDLLPQRHFIVDKLNPWWVASNYAFGLLFIPFGHIIVRFLARQFGNRGWWQQVLDGISGTTISKARAELERWNSLGEEALS